MTLEVIILAAGKGSRMRSALPKVLHPLAGKSLLAHVIDAAQALAPTKIHVVVGHEAKQVKNQIQSYYLQGKYSIDNVHWANQPKQLGTGHAVDQALPNVDPASTVLIMAGDVPLIKSDTLKPLCQKTTSGMHLLTATVDDAHGFGRIIRGKHDEILAIVEHKDATPAQLAITEFNTGIMSMQASDLKKWLAKIENKNAQGEYYLTDVIALAVEHGKTVHGVRAENSQQVMGVNSRAELSVLERQHQAALAQALMASGTSLGDPSRLDIRGNLVAGKDCFIDINAVFEQNVSLGDRVTIGPNVLIRNSRIGDDCVIEANSVIDHAEIKEHCHVGPFARIRPETHLQKNSKIGNFVEIKKSEIGEGSKVNHLSYIGDSIVGKKVNIGAGVITCNYDGANKHQTIIGDGVFVGSDCQLIAPVHIGEGATIGAGSTISKDAPANKLSLSRSKQMHLANWSRPVKSK